MARAVFAFPTQGVVVFGDVVEGDDEGGLRMPPEWWPPHEKRTARIRNELRRALDWPIDVVLVSHGEPVFDDPRLALQHVIADGLSRAYGQGTFANAGSGEEGPALPRNPASPSYFQTRICLQRCSFAG
jgi:glyoxylase-like metal-dependent hydrolase (beta-lactamase superfamily II)